MFIGNGTYILQAFWHNTDETKVDTFTRTVDTIFNTVLTTETNNRIVIGDELMLIIFYKSIHNNKHIMNARSYVKPIGLIMCT
ncbi:MAG: hypothetical protein ACFFFH_04250 [Candidatus Thorarchaeota archaeon]